MKRRAAVVSVHPKAGRDVYILPRDVGRMVGGEEDDHPRGIPRLDDGDRSTRSAQGRGTWYHLDERLSRRA
jgi:hypothetical protein